jgi:hypothetical protein
MKIKRLKSFIEMLNKQNDGNRSLYESIPVPEVESALKDWAKSNKDGVLIGGCAVDFYVRPRATMDVDFMFLSKDQIPNEVSGFKRIRDGAFRHIKTHVEIEVVTSGSVNIPQELVSKVYKTAEEHDGVRVASPSGLVALKLKRLKRHDVGDIVDLYSTGKVDLSGWFLTDKDITNYKEIINKYSN